MSLATAVYSETDYDQWLIDNTGYCKRHRSRLTSSACNEQRIMSAGGFGDLRCQDCGGLENQPENIDHIGNYGQVEPRRLHLVKPVAVEILLPVSVESEDIGEETAARISEQSERETCLDGGDNELARELQRLFLEEDETAIFDDAAEYSAACIDNEVLRLFPELREFIEECESKPNAAENKGRKIRSVTRSKQHMNKCAVYMGRCKRCNGYMLNALERHDGIKDDDVYRCFTCGWRTSPVYQFNRL